MNYDNYTTLNFNLTRRLDSGHSGPQLLEGPEGPGLVFDWCEVHSPDSPYGEAEGWLTEARVTPAGAAPGLALIFGLGLGYHLKLIRQKYPGIRLVVYEPIPELADVYAQSGVMTPADGPPPLIFTDWRAFEKTAGQEIVYGARRGVMVVAPEPYKALRPEAFGAFDLYAGQEIIRRAVIERTRENNDAVFLKNLAQNAGRLMELPDLLVLKGRLPARPAFLVGSGPSLDKNVDQLRQIGPRGLIMAPASTLKPLLNHGVRPDVVLVLESEDTSDYLQLSPAERETLGTRTVLALASGCHPAHFQVEGFHQAVYHLTAGEAQIFSNGLFLPQGGNSGSAVFALAYLWGLSPLVLVAQDQAYDHGRLHASGTPGAVLESAPETIAVRGVDDEVVETNTGLLASLGWFAEAARTIAGQPSPPPLYNCSASGARISGFKEVPLSAVTASLAPVNGPLDLAGILPRLPRPVRKEVEGDLSQLLGLVNSLRKLARMDYRKGYAEVKEAGRLSKFLGQVLAEAAVANGRSELWAALERADGLLTVMMSSLLSRD